MRFNQTTGIDWRHDCGGVLGLLPLTSACAVHDGTAPENSQHGSNVDETTASCAKVCRKEWARNLATQNSDTDFRYYVEWADENEGTASNKAETLADAFCRTTEAGAGRPESCAVKGRSEPGQYCNSVYIFNVKSGETEDVRNNRLLEAFERSDRPSFSYANQIFFIIDGYLNYNENIGFSNEAYLISHWSLVQYYARERQIPGYLESPGHP